MITQSDTLELIAARLSDRYALERELGRGGMATVYLARDLRHGRLVALKFLRPELSSILGAERFAREIAIAARLSHPHILPLLDSGALEGPSLGTILYYAMPYVEGRSLRERMSAEPQLPIEEAVGLACQVAQALDHAHHQGIVHRDIKPENILLSEGQAVVADFGIARALDIAGAERLTETGLAIGTPAYMSPEQGSASGRLDGRSDLYSLGCVLYEMLAGQPPFTGSSPQSVLARHAVDPVPPLRSVRSTVPRALERSIERALAKVPADRYATAAGFATALEEALTAPPDVAMAATPRRGSRRRRVIVGAVVALALVAGATATLRLRRSAPVYVPGRVVVAPFENQTGEPALQDFTVHLGATLRDAIAREGVGEPVPAATVRDIVERAPGPPGKVAEVLARQTGAGLQLRGACSRALAGTTCQVDVLRMPAKVLRMSVSVTGDPRKPSFIAELTERILVALLLQQTYGDRVTWLGEYLPRSLAAVRAFEQATDGDYSGWSEAVRLDTGWVDAAAWATEGMSDAEAESTLVQLASRPGLLKGQRENVAFHLATRRGDPELAFGLARRRFAVNPEMWVDVATVYSVVTGRASTALAISRYADSALHKQFFSYMFRGIAFHQLGRYQEELQLAHDLRRRFPTLEFVYRTHVAMALAALGEVDSLRRRLAEWEAAPEPSPRGPGAGTRAFIAGLELMAHGQERVGREVLSATLPLYRRLRNAEGYNTNEVLVLMWTDQLTEARRVARAALSTMRTLADSLDYLGSLGSIAARQGRRAEAIQYERVLAAAGQSPALTGEAAFQRAAIASRLGDREGAVRLLEEARAHARFGSASAGHRFVHRHPDFAVLRNYLPFQEFLKSRD